MIQFKIYLLGELEGQSPSKGQRLSQKSIAILIYEVGELEGQSPSKRLVKLPFRRWLWGKTAMACVLIVRTHCSFFPKRRINGSFTSLLGSLLGL